MSAFVLQVEDVRHLVFRFQRLQSLTVPGSVDFTRLQSLEARCACGFFKLSLVIIIVLFSIFCSEFLLLLELSLSNCAQVLSLSHNQLRDLQPFSALVSLSEVGASAIRIHKFSRVLGAVNFIILTFTTLVEHEEPVAILEWFDLILIFCKVNLNFNQIEETVVLGCQCPDFFRCNFGVSCCNPIMS